jgi:hypothetical protein
MSEGYTNFCDRCGTPTDREENETICADCASELLPEEEIGDCIREHFQAAKEEWTAKKPDCTVPGLVIYNIARQIVEMRANRWANFETEELKCLTGRPYSMMVENKMIAEAEQELARRSEGGAA